MTATANGERYCSQHHQPRAQCRPSDRHVWTGRARDDLMAAVAARVEAVGLPTMNDGMEMALEAWVRVPLQKVGEQALADRRIRHLPHGFGEMAGQREGGRRPAALTIEAKRLDGQDAALAALRAELERTRAALKLAEANAAEVQQARAALGTAQAKAARAEQRAAAAKARTKVLARDLEAARRHMRRSERDRAIAAAARAGKSHAVLAEEYGLTRQRISQIVREAGRP